MLFGAVFAITAGVMLIGQWTVTIIRRQVPGPEAGATVGRGRLEMLFHWAAEYGTAFALLTGGTGLLLDLAWGRTVYLVSMGMLVYTVVNSPGYFAQKREWPVVGMFAVLLVLALVSLVLAV